MKITWIPMALLLTACSGGGDSAEQDRLIDAQRDVLEQAQDVEALIQDTRQQQLQQIDQQSR